MSKFTDNCSICGSQFGFHKAIGLNCPKGLGIKGFQETVFSPIEIDIEILQKQLTEKDNLIKELVEGLEYVKNIIDESGVWWLDAPDKGGVDIAKLDAIISKTKQP